MEDGVVQVDESINHNHNAEQQGISDDPWSATVRDAVAAFSRQVGESSQQLAGAAEKFAADSMRVIDEATRKTEAAVAQSADSAEVARNAAEEARQLVESVRGSLGEAAERVKLETSSFFQDAVRQTEQAVTASQQVTAELHERLLAAVQQVEESASAGRDFAAQAAGAAQEARIAASETGANQAAGSAAEVAAEAARSAVAEMGSLRAAVLAAEAAAQEARQIALEANALAQQAPVQLVPEQVVSAGAQEVLERLEADYSLLTKLVQELHSRIASLSTQTAPVYQFIPPAQPEIEADANYEEASEPSYAEAGFSGADTIAEMVPPVSSPWDAPAPDEDRWGTPQYVAAEETLAPTMEEAPSYEEAVPEVEPVAAPPSSSGPTIAGRVLVSISPVPDFDRLLSLDGALGRMSGIGNVTLADYAKEEVTFRVEVDPATSVEDFRTRLSQSAGTNIEVVANSGETLALRLAS